jgi:hypothetical protein
MKNRGINMPGIKSIWMIVVLAVLTLATGACSESETPNLGLDSPNEGLTIAENFVKNSPTYKYDGIPETFKLSDTVHMNGRTQYVFEFDCRHPGYGDRTGQVLAQVIEHHVAMIIIENEQVISGIIDARWDMIHQQDLNPRGL